MQVEKSIFKAYDIRGIYPDQITADVAYAIGRAVATIFLRELSGKQITLAVGGDMRLSTPELKAKAIAGIVDSGIHVVDIGLVSTPAYYFGVAYYKYDGGVQVSASHNPGQYNGFKIVRSGGVAMSGKTGIEELHEIISAEAFAPLAETKGTVVQRADVTSSMVQAYRDFAGNPTIKPFNIVLDTANAMGGLDYPELFKQLGMEITALNSELDGTFPGHEADPLKPENTAQLQQVVRDTGADLGIAADGDADRIFIIDEKGNRIPSSILYTILAKEELEQNPGSTLAYEIRLGMIVRDEFERKGVSLVPTPVGHSLEKNIMLAHNAVFGGEISGHYFYRLPFGTFEAPVLLVLKLLTYLTHHAKPLSELVAAYDRYASSGEVNIAVANREVVPRIVETLKKQYRDGEQILLDGLKVVYEDWWFSLRASNTEPVMRLIVEATTQEQMEQKRDELLALMK